MSSQQWAALNRGHWWCDYDNPKSNGPSF